MATGNCSSGKGYISAASNVRLHPSEVSRMTNLEDDLLVEILIRLPNPRYSCRCKSVCKRWTSLISSPHFNRRFVSHHQSRYQTMLLSSYDTQPIIQNVLPAAAVPSDEADERRFVVLDSFKDLVLCGFTVSRSGNLELDRSYIVCNPFTKQWIALPLAPEKSLSYAIPCSRLVAEPRISSSSATVHLDLGDGGALAYSSEYRFRVVCMYIDITRPMRVRLDLFCSESGEWTKDALVPDYPDKRLVRDLVSYNEELFCSYATTSRARYRLGALHPFRLDDLPPTDYMDASEILGVLGYPKVTISQGALHLVALECDVAPGRLTVWRLEEDRKSWRKQCEGLVNTTSRRGNYELEHLYPVDLHPEKPEIVFLAYKDPHNKRSGIYSCNLTRSGGEIEFFAEEGLDWRVVQAKVFGWPTLIPRYEELRGMYNGSHSCWVQSSEAATPSIVEEYQPVDDQDAQFA